MSQDAADPFPFASEEELGEGDALYEDQVTKLPEPDGFSRGQIIADLIRQMASNGVQFFRISVPITFVAPMSMLETISLYYTPTTGILGMANARSAEDRFLRTVNWAMSNVWRMIHDDGFCHVKPYNPILGEQHAWKVTHQTRRGGENVTYGLAEQVSHHPPISSFYLSNRRSNFSIRSTITPSSKLHANSMTVHLYGEIQLSLHNLQEDYFLQFPALATYGTVMGRRFVEMNGLYRIECPKTNMTFMMWFKEKDSNKVVGRLWRNKDTPQETLLYKFSGYADKKILVRVMSNSKTAVFVDNERNRGQLPSQVTRPVAQMRPNETHRVWHMVTKHLREGNLEEAHRHKDGVENVQREKRRIRNETGEEHECEFFEEYRTVTQGAHAMNEDEEVDQDDEHTVPLFRCKLENLEPFADGEEDEFENLEIFG